MRALVAEDDPDVGHDIVSALSASGFVVDYAANGEEACYRGDIEDYDIVVLDLGLPRIDGLSVLRRWRMNGRHMPVLILSARGDWTEKVEGIETGADDYVAKPFEMGELLTRVRALVRRAAGHASSILTVGDMRIDTRHRTVTKGGVPVSLTLLEFRLLNYLAHHLESPASAGELGEHLYGAEEPGDSNAIEALVLRLRRKIGAATIETRRGFGYKLVAKPEG